MCNSMTRHPANNDKDILMAVFQGLKVYLNNQASAECVNITSVYLDNSDAGWDYQVPL